MDRRTFLKKSKYITLVPIASTILTACGGTSSGTDDSSNSASTVGTTSGTTTATAGVTVNKSNLITSETATSDSFTVVLDSQPSANVVITMSNGDSTEGSINPSSLTFTSSNWNSAQSVAVTGVDDNENDGNIAYNISFSATSTDTDYNGISIADLTVTNSDNDTAGVTVSTTTINTSETGTNSSFTVVLDSQPSADVVIAMNSGDSTEGSINPISLTFTSSNWNNAQTVAVTGVDDNENDGDIAYIISFSATSTDTDYNGISIANLTVTNSDNDTAGVTVSATTLNTSETATSSSFTVVLDSQPSADVVIAMSNGDSTEGSINPISLTFTSSNWNSAQTVAVTGVDDNENEGDIVYNISFSATSADTDYNGISIANLTVTNSDNDTAGVTVSTTTINTSETATSNSFTVVLDSQPTADVVITLSNSDATEGTLDLSSLTFTSSNWNTAQSVTVTGVDDSDVDGDVSYSISFAAASSDSNYQGISISSITVTNSDNDTVASASTTTLTIPPLVEVDSTNKISLQANEGTTEFYDGFASKTKGFVDVNNPATTSYLGPTIRVKSINANSDATGTKMVNLGSPTVSGVDQTDFNAVKFSVFNNTTGSITSHWHGLHVDGEVDGGPYNTITSGSVWEPTLNIYQSASTNWYHTHIHGSTADEVYFGLVGLFLIDDNNSVELDKSLPSDYGIDDFPLIIQDKSFVSNVTDPSTNTPNVGGRFAGDTMLVNGVINPNLEVEAGLNRFRILNASNARFYDFTVQDSSGTSYSFQKIATEGGFLGSPVTLTSLRMSPGERNEIVVDFSSFSIGDIITLKSAENESSGLSDPFDIMTFTVVAQTTQTSTNSVPATLNAYFDSDRSTLLSRTPDAYVYIHLTGGSTPFGSFRDTSPITLSAGTIPELTYSSFSMSNTNFVSTSTQTSANYTEQWFVRGITHPFHLHGCSAMIKTIGGSTPSDEYKGWKDVFEVTAAQDVVFMVQFNEKAESAATSGKASDFLYMMHCHILGHEDNGMMGIFEVI